MSFKRKCGTQKKNIQSNLMIIMFKQEVRVERFYNICLFISKLAFKTFEIPPVEIITSWQDFPDIWGKEKKNHGSPGIQAVCGMNLFTTSGTLVTWAAFVPEILSHNWRLIWFPRLLRVVDSGDLGWVAIDYSNHKGVGVPEATVHYFSGVFVSLATQSSHSGLQDPAAGPCRCSACRWASDRLKYFVSTRVLCLNGSSRIH